jgi:hypothetical protein
MSGLHGVTGVQTNFNCSFALLCESSSSESSVLISVFRKLLLVVSGNVLASLCITRLLACCPHHDISLLLVKFPVGFLDHVCIHS